MALRKAIPVLALGALLAVVLIGCGNKPPTAEIISPQQDVVRVTTGEEVSFRGRGEDPEGKPITYKWDFGDGMTCPPDCGSGTELNPTHIYRKPGTYIIPSYDVSGIRIYEHRMACQGQYMVTLTVMDGDGGLSDAKRTIIVGQEPAFEDSDVWGVLVAWNSFESPQVSLDGAMSLKYYLSEDGLQAAICLGNVVYTYYESLQVLPGEDVVGPDRPRELAIGIVNDLDGSALLTLCQELGLDVYRETEARRAITDYMAENADQLKKGIESEIRASQEKVDEVTAQLVLDGLSSRVLTPAQDKSECSAVVRPGESIQAAISQAAEGDVICLAEGTWEENFKIEKSLTLRGVDAEQTVIDGIKENYPVVWIAASEEGARTASVKIEGLKITGANGQDCVDWDRRICAAGVIIQDKVQVEITNSMIYLNGYDPFGYGIELLGSAKADISSSTIEANTNGISLWNSAQAEIADSTISGGRWGITLWDSTRAEIANSTIDGIYRIGIWVRDEARARIIHSTISGTGWYGIDVIGSAQAEVKNNIIERNGGCGISAGCCGEVRGEENRMTDNGADLCGNLSGELRIPLAEPMEEQINYPDERYENLQEAVDGLIPGGRLIIEAGEYLAGVTIAKRMTLEAAEEAAVTLKGRSEREAPVLSLIGRAELHLLGLKVTGGGTGIDLGADAHALIENCTITENWWIGIEARGRAEIEVMNASISRNGDGKGISLWESAQATVIHSTITGNGFWGLTVRNTAQAEIANSSISHNSNGIRTRDSAQVTISNSTITENGAGSIVLEDSAQAKITGSTISENGHDGILLEDSAEAKIERNRIINNGGYGVALYLKSCGFKHGEEVSRGDVSGCGDIIPDKDEPSGNQEGDVCPDKLSLLKEPCGDLK